MLIWNDGELWDKIVHGPLDGELWESIYYIARREKMFLFFREGKLAIFNSNSIFILSNHARYVIWSSNSVVSKTCFHCSSPCQRKITHKSKCDVISNYCTNFRGLDSKYLFIKKLIVTNSRVTFCYEQDGWNIRAIFKWMNLSRSLECCSILYIRNLTN